MSNIDIQMSHTEQTPITDRFQDMKAEGMTRSQRIGQILRTAWVDTAAEVKTGANHMRPMAEAIAATIMDDVKHKGETATTRLHEAWTDQTERADLVDHIQRILTQVGTALRAQVWPRVQEQAEHLDAQLSERYGDRYSIFKQRLDQAKVWYAQPQDQPAPAAAPPTAPVQVEIEEDVATVDVRATQTVEAQ